MAIMIRRSTFFREFFSLVSRSTKLFDFFVSVEKNPKSDAALYIPFADDTMIRPLVELMGMEYANKDENTQQILKPLVLTFFLYLMRQYEKSEAKEQSELPFSMQLEAYIRSNCPSITLQELADHFSYHPNYLSSYLKKELGKGFSQIVLEQRMANAKSLMAATSLSLEEISDLVGYPSPSNFYKAFKAYFKTTPRE
ncbi:helix-turn-helix transcriptional regulator [Erysipelotrichaceae bacterium RD49]|nr:helix-turn-helix transcriptional regulator [Erysipelotrichaceae bacterium RD49]